MTTDSQQTSKQPSKQSLKWLFKQARSSAVWIGLSVGLGLCSGLLLIVEAGLLSRIIHGAVMEGFNRNALWPLFAAAAALVLIRAFLGWGREVSGFKAGATVREQVRMTLMTHITRLGPAWGTGQETGALSSAVMEQVEGLHGFFAHYLPQLALAVMVPAAILAFVFPVSWAAGGLLLFTAPLIPLFMVLVGMGAESVSQRHFQALSRMSAHFLNVLQGLPTLKLFGRSRGRAKTVARISDDYRKGTMNVLRIAFLSSAVLEFFSSIAIALVAVYLGMTYLGYYDFGAWGQPMTLAGGFFILLLAPEFYLPLRELGTHYHARAEAVGAAEEILKILTVPVSHEPEDPIGLGDDKEIHLLCRDLHLAYGGRGEPAVAGISFEVNAGDTLTIVGESGAGKTTLLNLVLGFLQPDQGQIVANGVPINRLKPENWRKKLAWIGQDPILFHGTVRDNIRMGRPDASDAAVERAARSARVRDFTDPLPEGMDTRVGERGYGLSKGQAQRVALARAFLKDAPVLLLDEPTASLDAKNERLVMEGLTKLSAGRTVLMLTHHLAPMKNADRILVLSGGSIVEQGTFVELIATDGAFRQLVGEVAESVGSMSQGFEGSGIRGFK